MPPRRDTDEVRAAARARADREKVQNLPAAAKEALLIECTQTDAVEKLAVLLHEGVSPNSRAPDSSHTPALCNAAMAGSTRVLKALLDAGADVKQRDDDGDTALHLAAFAGRLECVQLLLLAGAEVDALQKKRCTPLFFAVARGHGSVCALLLAAGALQRGHDGTYALHLAAQGGIGSPAVINALLTAGGEVDVQDAKGRTPLHFAARGNCLGAIGRLLARGSNPNSLGAGLTPLMEAVRLKQILAVRALLPVSDLSVNSILGRNVVHLCAVLGSDEILRLLLDRVSDVDARSVKSVEDVAYRDTSLHLACMFGHFKMAQTLLRCGASRLAMNSNLCLPHREACSYGHLSCATLLLGRPGALHLTPAQVDSVNVFGKTALFEAAAGGLICLCGVLIQAGARLDAASESGKTPLMLAQQRHPDNAPLHALLAGNWAGPLPGTACERCAAVPESALLHCSGCLAVRYCCPRCAAADWPRHAAFCKECKEEREAALKSPVSALSVIL